MLPIALPTPPKKISLKFIDNIWSYIADRQTDKGGNITSAAVSVGRCSGGVSSVCPCKLEQVVGRMLLCTTGNVMYVLVVGRTDRYTQYVTRSLACSAGGQRARPMMSLWLLSSRSVCSLSSVVCRRAADSRRTSCARRTKIEELRLFSVMGLLQTHPRPLVNNL